MVRGTTRALAGALLSLVVATGCGGGGTDAGASPRDGATAAPGGSLPPVSIPPSVPAGGAVSRPLDAYVADAEQRLAIERATGLLVRECMKGKGFDYDPPEPRPLPDRRKHPYGIADAAQASRYGYHDPQIQSGEKKFSTERPPDAYLVALQGFARPPASGAPAGGGCLQEAQDRLRDPGQGSVDLDLVGRLAEQAVARTAADPRVTTVEKAWSDCMARRGFRYRTPAEPLSAPWPAVPSQQELATAKADVACKEEVRLPQTWHAVEAAYQQELVERHAAQLAEVKRSLEARLRLVTEVLEGKR